MRQPKWRDVSTLIAAGAATVLLAGCGGSGSGASPLPPPPPPPPPGQTPFPGQLGIGFAMKFAQALNSDPADAAASDLVPLNLAGDPIDVPDPM